MGGFFLVALGLACIGCGAHAALTGDVVIVWTMLGGWGSLSSSASRDESPTLYWAATIFYGVGGLLLAAYGAYRLLHGH